MSDPIIGIVTIVFLLILFLTGIEMAFAMGIIGFIGYAILVGPQGAANMIAKDVFEAFSSYGLTVIPLFVLMGQIAFNAGIAKRLYNATNTFIGHIPGGLALGTIAGVAIFKSICGSSAATTVTFAAVAVPEMNRFGYSHKLSTGVVGVSGTLGALLPPTVTLIIIGMITEQPIGRLFMAGFLPGIMLAALFACVVIGWCMIDPAAGPRGVRCTWKQRIKSLPEIMWPLIIFVIMIGGLMGGVFTPTEAGSVGTLAVLILTLLRKELSLRAFGKAVAESLRTSCLVFMLLACSNILGHFFAVTNIPAVTADWVVSLPIHRHFIMVIIIFVYLVGGSFIDDLAFLILATPIFFPAIMKLGYDPIWTGIMLCLTIMIGGVIPPVAMNIFIIRNITKVPLGVIYKGVYPFLIGMVIMAIALFLFPQIALYLPTRLMN